MRGLFKLSLFFLFLFVLGCTGEEAEQSTSFDVTVRLASEPDHLNPTRSRSSSATQIESLIMLPLAEYDPYSLELTPLLCVARADVDTLTSGPHSGGLAFHYQIRPEAVWEDGSPVTGFDYAFTVKAVLNPEVPAASWRGFLSFIRDVEVDPDNPKNFTVIVPEPYMLAEIVTCNFNIMPKYVYDPDGYMDEVPFDVLSDPDKAQREVEQNPNLKLFAESFSKPDFSRDVIVGSGPYQFVDWVTGDQIVLERKSDWWGDKLDNAPTLLHAYPSRIFYRVIPDETAALSALKDGTIDIVAEVTASNFIQMRDDEQWADKFAFHTPSLMQHNFITINTRHPILSDISVRKALAMAVDYDAIINTLLLGMASRTSGPFHSSKEYYNEGIPLDEYDIEEARKLLEESGWNDTNHDGIYDKTINGQRTELNLDVIVTQRAEGQQLALMFKESAVKAGIDIDIVTTDGSGLMQAVRSGDFELLPLRVRNSPSLDDPYQRWHSDNNQPGGSNRSGFTSKQADDIIEQIRITTDDEERNRLFERLSEIIYREKPVLFLYIPSERIIVNRKFEMTPSNRRPGYFESLFRLEDA